MSVCQWPDCTAVVPVSVYERGPSYQPKYCPEHRSAALRAAGRKRAEPSTSSEDRQSAAETRARSRLRQSVWEAMQFLTYDEVREYVEAVVREVESDEP